MPGKTVLPDDGPRPLGVLAAALALCAVAYRLMFSASIDGLFGNGLADLVVFTALALHMISMIRSGRPPLRISLASAALLLFFLAYLITARDSPYPRAAVLTLANLAALACLFVLVSGVLFREDDAPRACAYLVALAAVPVSVSVYQYVWEFPEMLREGAVFTGWVGRVYIDEQTAADFRTRIETLRVFARFFTPNVLAGYLALLIPATLALAFAVLLGAAARRARFLAAGAAFVLAAAEVLLLVLTKSKAGLASALVAVSILAAFFLYRFLPRKAFFIVLALVLIVGAVSAAVAFPRAMQFYNEAMTSLDVRLGYWRTSLRMIHSDPFTGVGPGNFGQRYVNFKIIGEREVRDPHNAFLLAWAEGGFFSLLFFVSFWALVFAGPREKNASPRCPTLLTMMLAVVAALALYLVVQADFQGPDIGLTAVVVAGSLASLLFLGLIAPAARLADPALVRAGLASGVVGFLLHAATDVDMSDTGAATAVIFAAAVLSPRGKAAVLAGRRLVIASFALLVSLGMLFFVGKIYLPFCQAEFAMEEAADYFQRGDSIAAADRARTAAALDPLNSSPLMLLGDIYSRSVVPGDADSPNFNVAQAFYKKVLERDPYNWAAHDRLARLYEAAGPDLYSKALTEYAGLISLYPANSQIRIRAAALLEEVGHYADALAHYREALSLDDETEEHGQQLGDEERARVRQTIERIKTILRAQGINPD